MEGEIQIPARVQVKRIVRSRYDNSKRPASWDDRAAGEDRVEIEGGHSIKLQSDGGQSTPQPGWVILLRGGNAQAGYEWTLYGLSHQNS